MRHSRQNKILELINTKEIETQDQLMELLSEAGYTVTQATISRDIKDLQLFKVLSASGKYKYTVVKYDERPISDRFIKIFRESTTSINSSGNIIVVKTLSGCGNAAAEGIDCLDIPHVIGSVAGDNTVMVVVDDAANSETVKQSLNNMITKRNPDA
ncbi:MAG: arginine repressor [Mogibacterium sp.]|nr:arginine repressor [Mogibacterium sp.]